MKIYIELNTEDDGVRKAIDILHVIDPENVKQKLEGLLANADTDEDDDDEDETIAEKKERKKKAKKKTTKKKVKKPKKKKPKDQQDDDDEDDAVVTSADVRKAMNAHIKEHGKKSAKKILSNYAEKLSEVDEDDFADLVTDLE